MSKKEIIGWILVGTSIVFTLIMTVIEANNGNAKYFLSSFVAFLLCSMIGAFCGLIYIDKNS